MCIAATGVVGDLCRALGVTMLPLCDEIMTKFIEGLAVCNFDFTCYPFPSSFQCLLVQSVTGKHHLYPSYKILNET